MNVLNSDIRADNVLLDFNGQVRITGVRQMVSLNTHGENIQSVWTVVGENLEWAAPEIIAQVGFNKIRPCLEVFILTP